MGILDALKGMFGSGGGSGAAVGDPVDYNDYQITPMPERTAGGWNTAGLITKTFADGVKEHKFIRVDTHGSKDDALAFSVTKAQQIIDEQGDKLFRER